MSDVPSNSIFSKGVSTVPSPSIKARVVQTQCSDFGTQGQLHLPEVKPARNHRLGLSLNYRIKSVCWKAVLCRRYRSEEYDTSTWIASPP